MARSTAHIALIVAIGHRNLGLLLPRLMILFPLPKNDTFLIPLIFSSRENIVFIKLVPDIPHVVARLSQNVSLVVFPGLLLFSLEALLNGFGDDNRCLRNRNRFAGRCHRRVLRSGFELDSC